MKITNSQITGANIGLFFWSLFALKFLESQHNFTKTKAVCFLAIVFANLLIFFIHRAAYATGRPEETQQGVFYQSLLLPFFSGASAFVIFDIFSLQHPWIFSFAYVIFCLISFTWPIGTSNNKPKT